MTCRFHLNSKANLQTKQSRFALVTQAGWRLCRLRVGARRANQDNRREPKRFARPAILLSRINRSNFRSACAPASWEGAPSPAAPCAPWRWRPGWRRCSAPRRPWRNALPNTGLTGTCAAAASTGAQSTAVARTRLRQDATTAFGNTANATGNAATATGSFSTANGLFATATGSGAVANGSGATATARAAPRTATTRPRPARAASRTAPSRPGRASAVSRTAAMRPRPV